MSEKVASQSYTLVDRTGAWLGQVVLTSDGLFASVTDWGNLSFAWRSFGDDFKEFILSLNTDYFATKMYTGMAYLASSRKVEAACHRFAEKILPPLQDVLREEMGEANHRLNGMPDSIGETRNNERGTR